MGELIEDGNIPPFFTIEPDELARVIADRDHDWIKKLGGPSGVAAKLRTDPENGLSGDELSAGTESRSAMYGTNRFKYPPPKSFFVIVYEAFKDVTILILSVAAIVSLVVGVALPDKRSHYGYLEGIAIVIVVFVVVLVQAIIDRNKEIKFRQLNSVKDNYEVQAIRAGVTCGVHADEVMVGDVIKVTAGDKLPADGILIQGSKLKTNESTMTGEPIDIAKDVDGDVILLSGTTVSEGVGHVLVMAVGERSQWGVILSGLVVKPETTPLQERLDRLAWSIGKLGILFACLTFLVSLIRWAVESSRSGQWDGLLVLEFFIDAITIVVVAIPEGLPLAITLGLAFAMRKMMRDNNLVRRLEACETMGSATQLNADKTGTLTQNRMTVVEANWAGHRFVYEGVENVETIQGALSNAFLDLASTNMSLNSQANLHFVGSGSAEHLGSKTECALLELVQKWDRDYRSIRNSHNIHRIYTFDSTKKSMSTSEILESGKVRLHTKGAPEIVLKSCLYQLESNGISTRLISDVDHKQILETVDSMASCGLRTLLMAYQDIEHDPNDESFWSEPPERGLVYMGVVGIKDPIRPETKQAVTQLKEAGVTVRMVTGDNRKTARFIAKEAGILDGDELVMEGPEFRKLTPIEQAQVATKIKVLARSSPNDKLLLVRAQRKLGEVTSVTGDGTNDGPALKEADVGFALGHVGTEVAKEACDIVILDDNIKSMTKAVLWGRNVYESIRKFLQFQLVVNIVAVILNFVSACVGVPLPLGAVPLLWVNMIMDSMGALALATEPPRPELLTRKPFGRHAPLINRAMYRNILGISVYQLVVCFILQFGGRKIFGFNTCDPLDGVKATSSTPCPGTDLKINSIIFNVFVFMQIGSEVNSRRIQGLNVLESIHKSPLFILIISLTVVIQVLLMLLVGGTTVGNSIGVGKINGSAWGVSLVVGLLVLPWGWLVRQIPLEWCYGPNDEDPTEMSKLEKLLHIPARKPFKPAEDDSEMFDDSLGCKNRPEERSMIVNIGGQAVDARSLMRCGRESLSKSPKVRLRVFVHAVAFVNVIQGGIQKTDNSEE